MTRSCLGKLSSSLSRQPLDFWFSVVMASSAYANTSSLPSRQPLGFLPLDAATSSTCANPAPYSPCQPLHLNVDDYSWFSFAIITSYVRQSSLISIGKLGNDNFLEYLAISHTWILSTNFLLFSTFFHSSSIQVIEFLNVINKFKIRPKKEIITIKIILIHIQITTKR